TLGFSPGFPLVQDGGRRPAIGGVFDLLVEQMFIGIDVLLHEPNQLFPQFLSFLRVFEHRRTPCCRWSPNTGMAFLFGRRYSGMPSGFSLPERRRKVPSAIAKRVPF